MNLLRSSATLLILASTPFASFAETYAYCPEGMTCLAQAKPPEPSGPSLEELGFSEAQTKGSAEDQARLDKRSKMLKTHQRLGLLTTIPFIAALLTAPGGHAGSGQRDLHAAIGSTAVIMYSATAYYAIFAPKIPGTESKGPTKVHKALAWVHFPAMVMTPILGGMALDQRNRGEKVHGIAQYHNVAAGAAVLSYVAAMAAVSIRW
jgi:hypothetical protein